MTDLTMERLDELEKDWRMWVKYDDPTAGLLGALGVRARDVLALIARAKRTEAAESAMGMYACEMAQFADEVEELERERDEASQYARDWRRCAERLLGERDALRALVEHFVYKSTVEWNAGPSKHRVAMAECRMCGEQGEEPLVHDRTCPVIQAKAALAQPTDAGGAE